MLFPSPEILYQETRSEVLAKYNERAYRSGHDFTPHD